MRISTEYDFVLSYVIVEKKYEVGPLRVAPQGPEYVANPIHPEISIGDPSTRRVK
jgi:hypothetical protein